MIYELLKVFIASQMGTPLDIFALSCILFALLGTLLYVYGKRERVISRPRHGFTSGHKRQLSFIGLAAVSLWMAQAVVFLLDAGAGS